VALGDLLWASGFDNQDTGIFNLAVGNVSFVTSGTRTPQSVAYADAGSTASQFTLAASSAEFMVGFGFKTAVSNPTADLLTFVSVNNTTNFGVALDGSTHLRVTRNGTLVGSAGSTVLSTNVWYWVWLYVKCADSGRYRVYLDDNSEIAAATGDTRNDSGTNGNLCDRVTMMSSTNYSMDDLYIFDATGTASDGDDVVSGITAADSDRTIPYLLPTSDGNYTQLTPSTGSSHYALVDEVPPNTTDYNASATNANKDSYGMSNLSNAAEIDGLVVRAVVQKSDAGAKSGRVFLRSSSTDNAGSDESLSTGGTWTRAAWHLAQSPFTSSAWTASEINAMEAGWEVRA